MGKWEKFGEQMMINLESAREQYRVLGYPHRKIILWQCTECRKVVFVDSSIRQYDYCPHYGSKMEVAP